MRIAIFGATSQIAKDLILSLSAEDTHELALFARRPELVARWLATLGFSNRHTVADFGTFGTHARFDAILNFVGIGNPTQVVALGAAIFDVTLKFDQMALSYLRQHPYCRYVFLSSGAAYGSNFEEPVTEYTKAIFPVNNLQPQDWYGVAKLHAESVHRSLSHLPIVDIRVFNYFSHTQDISARFLITDVMRAIESHKPLVTSAVNIVRDYVGPDDFCQLVSLILAAPARNDVVDCYSKGPVDKMTLLSAMKAEFGLKYDVEEVPSGVNATGMKLNYFSVNRRGEAFGYAPSKGSLECVLDEARLLVRRYDR